MSEARINLPAKIFPTGNFETHEDIYGKGGFVVLNDNIGSSGADEFINERITYQRRKEGMLVYLSSNSNYYRCVVTGSSESEGQWTQQYFSGRYFHGASAPTADNLRVGEKWFNTTVGSEFTYLPTDEDQDTFFWVDIDHIGQGESGDIGIDLLVNGESFATDSSTLNITGSSYITVAQEGSNGYSISLVDSFVNTSGDIMTGTLTGTDASFDTIEGSTGVFSFLGIGSDTFSAQDIIDPDAEPIIFGVTGGRNSYFDTNVTIGASGSTSKGWLWVRGGLDESVNSFQVEGNSVFRDSVEIGKDSFYALNFGSTAYQGPLNPNVPVIESIGGVLIGGNTYAKQNWLGNDVLLSPTSEHSVLLGFPLSYDTSDQEKLTVTGGIASDRIFVLGSGKGGLTGLGPKKINTLFHALAAGITTVAGFETPLFSVQDRQDGGWVNAPKIRRVWPTGEINSTARTDSNFELDEYITRRYIQSLFAGNDNYTIIPSGSSTKQITHQKQTTSIAPFANNSQWVSTTLGGVSSLLWRSSADYNFQIPNFGSYPNIISIQARVYYDLPNNASPAQVFFNATNKHISIQEITDNGSIKYKLVFTSNTNPNAWIGALPQDFKVDFIIISAPTSG